MLMHMIHPTADELIDLLGGTVAVSRLVDVQPPSVSEWRKNGEIPSDKRVLLAKPIEAASTGKYRCWDVCPDRWFLVWPELIGTPGAPKLPSRSKAPA